ncbi:MAG: hypothetical protein HY908_20785 [Myxococcales bacterium]|nr:hypothetical protein [Myxococcales bacterium]
MRHWTSSMIVAIAALGLGAAGCTTTEDPEYAPGFADQSGQGVLAAPAYPDGPYGVEIGEVLPNMAWTGYVNSLTELGLGYHTVQLSDFYNPTGTAVYGEGELLPAGTPKPLALWITGPAMWCGPCQAEAKYILPPAHDYYFPLGGQILSTLLDNGKGDGPATLTNLDYWAKTYKANYPLVNDPDYLLGPAFAEQAFPANFLVDPRTMQIKVAIAGAPPPQPCCPQYGCSNAALPSVCGQFGITQCVMASECSFFDDYEAIMDGTFTP